MEAQATDALGHVIEKLMMLRVVKFPCFICLPGIVNYWMRLARRPLVDVQRLGAGFQGHYDWFVVLVLSWKIQIARSAGWSKYKGVLRAAAASSRVSGCL